MCEFWILGSGSEATISPKYKGKEKRTSPALLLQHDKMRILFDAGPDIAAQLKKVPDPQVVFITHAHPDHIDGIDDLGQQVQRFLKEPGVIDHLEVIPVPVDHSRIAPAVGFVILTDHLKLLYFPDFLRVRDERLLRGADLAFFDTASLRKNIERGPQKDIGHQSALNSIRMAKRLGIKNIIFTHIGTIGGNHDWLQGQLERLAEEEKYPGKVILARDTMHGEITIRGLEVPIAESEEKETIPETDLAYPAYEIGASPETGITGEGGAATEGLDEVVTTELWPGVTGIAKTRRLIDVTPILYLKHPHAELIAKGEKTLIVKTVKFTRHLKIPVFIASTVEGESFVYAKIYVGNPEPISVREFWDRADEHRITREEFEDWGWKGKDLFAYKIQVIETYDPPKRVELPRGPQVWILNYKWIDEPPKEIMPLRELELARFRHEGIDFDIEHAPERWRELNADHRYLHIGYVRLKKGLPWGEWTIDDIVRYHAKIVDVMREMGFPYHYATEDDLKVELDRLSKKFEKTRPPATEEEEAEWAIRRRKIIKAARLPEYFIAEITPEFLEDLEDDALIELHSDLHSSFSPEEMPDEALVNAHLFVVAEMEERGLEHEFWDELDRQTLRLRAKQGFVPEIVEFLVTWQAVSLTGSAVYGERPPKDLDWVIRHPPEIPELERFFRESLPEFNHHFVYELKGPNWKHIPVADFIVRPEAIEENRNLEVTIDLLDATLPKEVRLKPYIFWDGESIRVNSDLVDNGTLLKLERMIGIPGLVVIFSTLERENDVCLGWLWLRMREEFEPVELEEPEFEPFYGFKIEEQRRKLPPITKPITKIKLGEWFPPVKAGAFGYAAKEVFNVDEGWEFWGKPILERDFTIVAEQKFDGTRLQWHINRKEGWVRCFTEGAFEKKKAGIDVAVKMPDVVRDALENLPVDDCILDTETVLYEEGRPLRREEMAAILVRKEPTTEADIRVMAFDLVWLNGKDLSKRGYLERKELLKSKVLPKNTRHFYFVEHRIVKDKDDFYAAYEYYAKLEGSEGVMLKTHDWEYTLKGRIPYMTKVKVLFEIDVMIIGRRKVPRGKPPKKRMTAEQMEELLPDLIERSRTWTFRCAFLGPDGKLWPLYSEKTWAPGDVKLTWDEERQKWKGLEDPKYWEMMKGFPNSKVGELMYGNTYNYKPPKGIEPKLGDIITVAPAVIRAWKDEEGRIRVSWIFPRPRMLKPERKKPDDWKVVNAIISAVARRHGEKPELLLGGNIPVAIEPQLREEIEPLTREEQRELAEFLFGDPYMVEGDKKFPFIVMFHERGLWSPRQLPDIKRGLRGPNAREIWRKAGCFELISPLDEMKRAVQKIADVEGDVSAEVRKHLSPEFPKKLDLSRVVNLGNVHMDLRMRSPAGRWLLGWTLDTPSVLLQFLEDGRIEHLLRNKFLENQPRDNIVSQRKCPNILCPASLDDEIINRFIEDSYQEWLEARQPMVWLRVVTRKRPEYWAEPGEVGATKGTAGRLVFGDAGQVAFGVSKPDYHEYFFWFEDRPKISGRWGWQLIAGRPEYAKVAEEWWMGNKPHVSLGPYILTHSRKFEETKARREKHDLVLWVPQILDILARDEQGRGWLRDQLRRIRLPEGEIAGRFKFLARFDFTAKEIGFLNRKFEEFSANEGRWELKKTS